MSDLGRKRKGGFRASHTVKLTSPRPFDDTGAEIVILPVSRRRERRNRGAVLHPSKRYDDAVARLCISFGGQRTQQFLHDVAILADFPENCGAVFPRI
jgi:hypothetical protein